MLYGSPGGGGGEIAIISSAGALKWNHEERRKGRVVFLVLVSARYAHPRWKDRKFAHLGWKHQGTMEYPRSSTAPWTSSQQHLSVSHSSGSVPRYPHSVFSLSGIPHGSKRSTQL